MDGRDGRSICYVLTRQGCISIPVKPLLNYQEIQQKNREFHPTFAT